MSTGYTPPRKPDKLDADCMWVSVKQVHRSDGFGPGEQTWAGEFIGWASTERAARECAETWFNETDQSDECEITLSLERANGTIVAHRVIVGPRVMAKVVNG